MRGAMKKVLIRIAVLLVIFVASAAVFAQLINDETKMQTEDMSQATLPLVYMVYKDVEMNPLHGYVKPMAVTAVRDTLTPISTERDMSIEVQTFGAQVSDIYFEVFTADGETSLENTKVTNLSQDGDYVTASFTLQNFMRMNQEYVLKIQLRADGRDILLLHPRGAAGQPAHEGISGFCDQLFREMPEPAGRWTAWRFTWSRKATRTKWICPLWTSIQPPIRLCGGI